MTLAGALFASAAGCSEESDESAQRPAPMVVVDTPDVESITASFRYNGTLRSIEEVDIRARVPGFLERVAFEPSRNVSKGDLLFVIERAPYEAAVERAEGAVSRIEAQLELAKARAARTESAAEEGASTEIERIEARALVDQREGELKIARAELRSAKLDLGYTEVRSPIEGRVDEHYVDVGNLVGAGENTLLTTVVRMAPIYAYFDVSEDIALQYFERGDDGDMEDGSPAAFLGLANEEGYPHEGRIDYVDNELDPSTGTIRVRAVFPNESGLLYPGLYARIRVPFDRIEEAVLIDRNAAQRDLKGDYVLVTDGEGGVTRRYVTLGERQDGGRIHVREGLGPDDRYVVSGQQKVRPGAPVRTQMRGAGEENASEGAPGERGSESS